MVTSDPKVTPLCDPRARFLNPLIKGSLLFSKKVTPPKEVTCFYNKKRGYCCLPLCFQTVLLPSKPHTSHQNLIISTKNNASSSSQPKKRAGASSQANAPSSSQPEHALANDLNKKRAPPHHHLNKKKRAGSSSQPKTERIIIKYLIVPHSTS